MQSCWRDQAARKRLLWAGQLKGPVAPLQARQQLLVKIAAAIESQEGTIMQANEEDVKVTLVSGGVHVAALPCLPTFDAAAGGTCQDEPFEPQSAC